jgi:heme/copper-type cytochrome/quinol oxidase subunit 2
VPSVVIRVVGMSAQNWSFTPNVIKAKRGENLRIQLHGVSGTHGFSAPAFGINVPIAPGERTTVTIPTNKAGTYEFFCSIPCGSGHKQMRGSIIIE